MKRLILLLVCCAWLAGFGSTQASVIHNLVSKGDLAGIKILLQHNPKLVNEKNEDDYTPLHIAAEGNRAEIALYLLDKGADVSAVNADGFTPLQYASFLGKVKTARVIIERSGKCDIYSAVMLDDKELVTRLLDADPKLLDSPDINGDRPLYTAAASGHPDIAKLLLDRGANVNLSGSQNGTPIMCAVERGNLELVKVLLEGGADLTAPENATILDWTMSEGLDDIARLLLQRGARVSIFYATYSKDLARVASLLDANPKLCNADRGDWTPLHIAAERNATEVAKLLIAKGANVNAHYPGYAPLNAAARTGSKAAAVLLLERGAKINAPKGSDSALHSAAEHNQNDIARLLISRGAKIDARGELGYTPLSIAAQRGNRELAAFLISKKCAVNAKDGFGATALGWASGKGHKEVAALLARHGGRSILPPKAILSGKVIPQSWDVKL